MRRHKAFLAALVLLVAGCASPPAGGGGGPGPLTLQVGDQKGQTKAILNASGLLRTLPFHVKFSTFTSGPPEVEALNANAIDVASVGNTPAVVAAGAHANVSMIAADQSSPSGDAILVPHGSRLHGVSSLRGKTIAVADSTSAHGHLLLRLRRAGLSKSDVRLAYLQPADAFAAFSQGDVDAWAIWEPYTSQAMLKLGARVLVNGTGVANGFNIEVAGNRALADPAKSAAIGKLVVAIAKAELWSRSHPDQWARAYARDTGLSVAVARHSIRAGVRVPIALDDSVIRSEQRLMNVFVADHAIRPGVRFRSYVNNRYATLLRPYTQKGFTR